MNKIRFYFPFIPNQILFEKGNYFILNYFHKIGFGNYQNESKPKRKHKTLTRVLKLEDGGGGPPPPQDEPRSLPGARVPAPAPPLGRCHCRENPSPRVSVFLPFFFFFKIMQKHF